MDIIYGKVVNCTNSSKTQGTRENSTAGVVGGIVGWNKNNSSSIEQCTNSGQVISKSNCTGGISGSNEGKINSCINNGTVTSTGASGTGGIVGYQNLETAETTNSQNRNEIKGVAETGGIVGNNNHGKINNCNNERNITGMFNVGGISGANANNSEIIECKNIAKITYDSVATNSSKGLNIGGIIGKNQSGAKLINSQNEGEVVGIQNVGGAVGYSLSNSTINQCSNSAKITGSLSIAGICGFNETSTIENSHNTGNIISDSTITYNGETANFSRAGGICGQSNLGYISNSYNEGQIDGNAIQIGGIVGACSSKLAGKDASVEKCYNTGKIKGTSSQYQTGGICGYLYSNGLIRTCFNKGEVSGSYSEAGGIVGILGYRDTRGYIENCYNVGTINATQRLAGGIAGDIWNGEIRNSYNVGNVSVTATTTQKGGITAYYETSEYRVLSDNYYLNTTSTGGINGTNTFGEVESKTMAELKAADFINRINDGNSVSQWKRDTNNINGGYPILSWQ